MEGTPELSAVIKTSSNGGENILCKNGSGKKKKEKQRLHTGNITKVSLGKLKGGI